MKNGFARLLISTSDPKTPADYKKLVKKAHYGDKKAVKKLNKLMKKGDKNVRIAIGDFQRNSLNRYSQQEGSTMIHEKDYVPMNCCLCGADMPTIHHTHNPSPLTPKCYAKEAIEENLPHRCCGRCDQTKVIPQRIRNMGGDPSTMKLVGTPKLKWIDPKKIDTGNGSDYSKDKKEGKK